MLKALCIMPKAQRIMLKAPNKMSFDHLRQLWLSIHQAIDPIKDPKIIWIFNFLDST
jgi:hypothetical protein